MSSKKSRIVVRTSQDLSNQIALQPTDDKSHNKVAVFNQKLEIKTEIKQSQKTGPTRKLDMYATAVDIANHSKLDSRFKN